MNKRPLYLSLEKDSLRVYHFAQLLVVTAFNLMKMRAYQKDLWNEKTRESFLSRIHSYALKNMPKDFRAIGLGLSPNLELAVRMGKVKSGLIMYVDLRRDIHSAVRVREHVIQPSAMMPYIDFFNDVTLASLGADLDSDEILQ